jgi:hypothetical protein
MFLKNQSKHTRQQEYNKNLFKSKINKQLFEEAPRGREFNTPDQVF